MRGIRILSNMNSTKSINREQLNINPTRSGTNGGVAIWMVMRHIVLLLVTVSLAAAGQPTAQAAPPQHEPNQILVRPKPGVSEDELQILFAGHRAAEVGAIHQINVRVLRVPEAELESVVTALRQNPRLEFVEPDSVLEPDLIPDDPYFPSEWHLPIIGAPTAWDVTLGSSNLVIAILDSGVDASHPDLAPEIVPGWNFYDTNSNTADINGHGTAVAGAAAARGNNGVGVAGLVWGCRIMPVRITDTNGNGTIAMIADGLTWAADQGARVANISFTVSASPTVTSAAQYFQSMGGLVIAGAGNNGIAYTNGDNPFILTVSATDPNDVIETWSTTGSNIDLSAPGEGILTTALGGGYASGTGTSFSAPIVAGVAALVLSVNPGLSGAQVRGLLEQTADDLGPAGWDTSYGYGRVNASNAVFAAVNMPASNAIPPTVTITAAPAGGNIVSGIINVDVSATDGVGVTNVGWYLDGVLTGSGATAPADFSWNTTQSANGAHTLQAKASGVNGNVGASAVVTVRRAERRHHLPAVRHDYRAPGRQRGFKHRRHNGQRLR